MAEHPNATIVREMAEAASRGDFETAASYVAEDVVWHEIGRSEPRRGMAEMQASRATLERYEITWEPHDVIANDDHVVALGTATAVDGARTLTYRTAEIYHVRNGKVVERWAFSDDTQRIMDFFA